MKPSKRELWKDVERLEGDDAPTDITVSSEVVTVTDPDDDAVDVPEGATLLETESPVVTAWIEPDD